MNTFNERRARKPNNNRQPFCGFCKRNGEPSYIYLAHVTHGPDGKVVCPQLRRHVCELCKATGDEAHTRSYCPIAENSRSDPLFRELFDDHCVYNMVALKQTRVNSAGKPRKS